MSAAGRRVTCVPFGCRALPTKAALRQRPEFAGLCALDSPRRVDTPQWQVARAELVPPRLSAGVAPNVHSRVAAWSLIDSSRIDQTLAAPALAHDLVRKVCQLFGIMR